MRTAPRVATFVLALSLTLVPFLAQAQSIPVEAYSSLKWRNVGPFRGGRVASVTGAIGRPGVYYMGLPMGGAWKTTNSGVTWFPIMDQIKEASSVGAIEAAPSNPDIVYVGMGDIIVGGGLSQGNGMYKSTDGGKTWQYLGFPDAGHIGSIVVDPKDPNIVQVAIKGHVRKRTKDRGIFRSTDGGKTWTQTLAISDEVGGNKITYAWDAPNIMLATTVQHYNAPGTNGPFGGFGGSTGTKLYKSTDGGQSWAELNGSGLPKLAGRTGLAIAQGTGGKRMFIVGNFGLYRSDDGGQTWRQMAAKDRRIRNGQGGYNCGVYVNPQNPDTVYVINTCSYVSRDGGETFVGFKGAPGGDDPQQAWFDPTDGNRFFFGTDQGATITLDGGQTWSNWYNQPSAQVYHIGVDNQMPYWIYATMQDSGAIGTASRGNLGAITPFDWTTNPGFEFGSIVADPLNPNITYVGSQSGGIAKVDKATATYTEVSPSQFERSKYRHVLNQPLLFAPANPKELLAGYQFVSVTTDGGQTWKTISPDLTVRPEQPEPKKDDKKVETKGLKPGQVAPDEDDDDEDADDEEITKTGDKDVHYMRLQRGNRGGSIQCLASSPLTSDIIWVGTSNGIIQVTKDHGKTWNMVNIASLPVPDRADVLSVEASHFEPGTAYVTVTQHTIGDFTPYVYRTRDFGQSWKRISDGIPADVPSGNFARVIREDSVRKGLLFLGTESSVYVSFDDGDHWQPLGLNLPNTSYRDMVVKGNDLVVGTYGRGFWILDDFSPLREISPSVLADSVYFYQPAATYRLRRNVNYDTPFPPEVAMAPNPWDCTFSYFLKSPAKRVTITVIDGKGRTVQTLSSDPVSPDASQQPIPEFWKEIPRALPTEAGLARVEWNLRYSKPEGAGPEYDINATPLRTQAGPLGPMVGPGKYKVVLNVDGKEFTKTIEILHDPRSPRPASAVRKLADLQADLWEFANRVTAKKAEVDALKVKVTEAAKSAKGDEVKALESLAEQLTNLASGSTENGLEKGVSLPGLSSLAGAARGINQQLDYGDEGPNQSQSQQAAYLRRCEAEIARRLAAIQKSFASRPR